MITKAKRTAMEELIYKVYDTMDKSGKNTEKYKNKFDAMTNDEFSNFFDNFFNSDSNFVFEFEPYSKFEPTIEDARKASKVIGFPLEERIVLRHLADEEIVTDYDILVLPIHLKRLQQLESKKNAQSIRSETRDPKTGQVINEDKNARLGDVENAAALVVGLEKTAKEMMGPRSDDLTAKMEMHKAIMTKGYFSLDELSDDVRNKTTLRTVDTFFLAAGINTDLVTSELELIRTIDNKKDVKSVGKEDKETSGW